MFNLKKITTQNCFDTEGGVWFWYQSLCTMFTCTRLNFSLVIFSSKILYISCLFLPFGDIYCLIMKSHFPWVCLWLWWNWIFKNKTFLNFLLIFYWWNGLFHSSQDYLISSMDTLGENSCIYTPTFTFLV